MLAASCGVGDLLVIEALGGQPHKNRLPPSPVGVVTLLSHRRFTAGYRRVTDDMDGRDPGSKPSIMSRRQAGKDGTMRLFGRTPGQARTGRKPTRAERQAAERTAQAEAKLEQTEQRIHDLADEVRGELG